MKFVKTIIQWIFNIFRYQKKKIFFLLVSTVFCFILLFPFDDLSDFITVKISETTGDNLYLQFDKLSFSLIPQPGIKMNQVVVESSYAPTIKVKELAVSPKISSLVSGKPGGVVKSSGFFGGQIMIDFGPSRELNLDQPETGVVLAMDELNLKELSQFLQKANKLPLSFSGKTNIQSKLHLDLPGFKEQPKGDFKIHIQKFKIPASRIPLGPGLDFPLPQLIFKEIKLMAKIDDKKLTITEGKIGNKKDNFNGSITGDIFIDIKPGFRLKEGGYDLKLNLNISHTLKEQLGAVFGFVDIYQGIGEKYKFDTLKGIQYSMQISSSSFKSPPRISSL